VNRKSAHGKKPRIIDSFFEDVPRDKAHIKALLTEDKGEYVLYDFLLEDSNNIETLALRISMTAEGRVRNLTKIEPYESSEEYDIRLVITDVMKNKLGESLYSLHINDRKHPPAEFDIIISPSGEIEYIQGSPDDSLSIND
jgi:hypothetical protein